MASEARGRIHVGLVIGRLWRHSIRQPAFAYIIPTVMPLGLVVFISQLYDAMASRPGYPTDNLLDWMGPGIAFLAATMGGGFAASSLVVDAESGFLERLRLLPLGRRSIVVGCMAFEGLRMVPVAAVLLAAAFLLGLPVPGVGGLVLAVALAALWAAAWNAGFIVAALRTRNPQLSLVLLPLFLPFFLASSVMVPRDLLPGYVQAIITWNPLDRFVVAARPIFLDGPVDPGSVLTAIAIAVALLAVFGVTAQRQLVRMARS